MNTREYNVLGMVTDTTYSDSATAGAFKVIPKITSANVLTVTCMCVVNLLNRSEMHRESEKATGQLDSACNEEMKRIKKEFKTHAGRTLKAKTGGVDHSVELISMSGYSQKGTALIRRVYKFEVS